MVISAEHEILLRRCFEFTKGWDVVTRDALAKKWTRLVDFQANLDSLRKDIAALLGYTDASTFSRNQNYIEYAEHLQKVLQLIDQVHVITYEIFKGRSVEFQKVKSTLLLIEKIMEYTHGILIKDEKIVSALANYNKCRVDASQLQTGDILAQFANIQGIVNIAYDSMLRFLRHSSVNHVMLILNEDSLRFVDFVGKGLRYKDFHVRPGAVYIVLRPTLSNMQRDILVKEAHAIMERHPTYSPSERIGAYIARAINIVTPSPVRNFFNVNNAYYCSEFIDELFNKIGIQLTHRSVYSNTVLASDLLCSNQLEFVGLVYDDSAQSQEILVKEARVADV